MGKANVFGVTFMQNYAKCFERWQQYTIKRQRKVSYLLAKWFSHRTNEYVPFRYGLLSASGYYVNGNRYGYGGIEQGVDETGSASVTYDSVYPWDKSRTHYAIHAYMGKGKGKTYNYNTSIHRKAGPYWDLRSYNDNKEAMLKYAKEQWADTEEPWMNNQIFRQEFRWKTK